MELIAVGVAGILIGLTFGYVLGAERGAKRQKEIESNKKIKERRDFRK